MRKSKYISINKVEKITEFCNKCIAVDGDIDVKRGRYVVDGKSLLGLFSLDIYSGATVEYPADAIEFDAYLEQFEIQK